MSDLLCNNALVRGLKDANIRLTAQRIAIAQWLEQCDTHPTVGEVHEALLGEFPTMSLATVYNTISLLVELDLIHEVGVMEDGSRRYEPNNTPHINLMCKQCGRIIDEFEVDMAGIKQSALAHDFLVHDASITVHGLCSTCRQAQDA